MPPLFDVGDIARRFSGSVAAGQRGGGIMDQIAGYGNPEVELWKKQVSEVWNDPENEAYRQQFASHLETRNSQEAQKALFGLTTHMLQQGLPGPTVNDLVMPFSYQLNLLSDEAKENRKAMEFMLGQGIVEIDPSSGGGVPGMGQPPPIAGTPGGGAPAMGQPPPMTVPGGGGVSLPDPNQPDQGIPDGGLPGPMELRSQLPAAQQQQLPQSPEMSYGGFRVRAAQRPTLGKLFEGKMDPNDPMANLPIDTEKAAEYIAQRYDEGSAFDQAQLAARYEALAVQREGYGVQREGHAMQLQRMQEDAAARAGEQETPYTLGQFDPEAPESVRGMPLNQKQALGLYKSRTGGDFTPYQQYQIGASERREERETERDEVKKLETQWRTLEIERKATIKAMSEAAGVPINPEDKYQLDTLSDIKKRKIAPMYGLWRQTTQALTELYRTSPLLQDQFAVPPSIIPREKRKKKSRTPSISPESEDSGSVF